MIVLDANVVSEAMKPAADPAVRSWLNEQVAETLYLASVTLAELLFGIGALPDGRRKKALAEMLGGVLELFGDRVLPFDIGAARYYAGLAVTARAAGNCRHCRLQGIHRRDARYQPVRSGWTYRGKSLAPAMNQKPHPLVLRIVSGGG
jgi:predicted nucleic acid-binding protein